MFFRFACREILFFESLETQPHPAKQGTKVEIIISDQFLSEELKTGFEVNSIKN